MCKISVLPGPREAQVDVWRRKQGARVGVGSRTAHHHGLDAAKIHQCAGQQGEGAKIGAGEDGGREGAAGGAGIELDVGTSAEVECGHRQRLGGGAAD